MTVEPTGNKDISGLGSLNKGTAYQNFSGSTLGKEAILNLKKANSDLFAARQSDIDTELDSLCTEYDFVKRKKDSKAWTSQQAIDTDIVVAEPGIKGEKPAFRLQDDKLACINYSGSHEPMNMEEFKAYLDGVNTKINGTAEKPDIDTEEKS